LVDAILFINEIYNTIRLPFLTSLITQVFGTASGVYFLVLLFVSCRTFPADAKEATMTIFSVITMIAENIEGRVLNGLHE